MRIYGKHSAIQSYLTRFVCTAKIMCVCVCSCVVNGLMPTLINNGQ